MEMVRTYQTRAEYAASPEAAACRVLTGWVEADFAATPIKVDAGQESFAICADDRRILDTLSTAQRPAALRYLYQAWRHEMARREYGAVILPRHREVPMARDWDRNWQAYQDAAAIEYEAARPAHYGLEIAA